MSEQDRTEQAQGAAAKLAARLRALADLLDAHPELEKFPELFQHEGNVFLQAYTEDYEKATGKTIDLDGGAE